MAAGAWKIYDEAKISLADGTIDLDTHTFKIALFLSTSNCNNVALATAQLATLTNQVANGSGYTTGGLTLTSVTWAKSGSTSTFDAADAVWTASGGSITTRFAVIYSDTATNKNLLAVCLLDTTPADVTATDGNTLTIQFNASGIFTLTGATSD
jgi:hypothetical protein